MRVPPSSKAFPEDYGKWTLFCYEIVSNLLVLWFMALWLRRFEAYFDDLLFASAFISSIPIRAKHGRYIKPGSGADGVIIMRFTLD